MEGALLSPQLPFLFVERPGKVGPAVAAQMDAAAEHTAPHLQRLAAAAAGQSLRRGRGVLDTLHGQASNDSQLADGYGLLVHSSAGGSHACARNTGATALLTLPCRSCMRVFSTVGTISGIPYRRWPSLLCISRCCSRAGLLWTAQHAPICFRPATLR